MCQVTHTVILEQDVCFMGLFKKAYGCGSCERRVRQKPARIEQLDLFGDNFNERVYVRSSKKRPSYGKKSFKASVLWGSSVDSSDECPF